MARGTAAGRSKGPPRIGSEGSMGRGRRILGGGADVSTQSASAGARRRYSAAAVTAQAADKVADWVRRPPRLVEIAVPW